MKNSSPIRLKILRFFSLLLLSGVLLLQSCQWLMGDCTDDMWISSISIREVEVLSDGTHDYPSERSAFTDQMAFRIFLTETGYQAKTVNSRGLFPAANAFSCGTELKNGIFTDAIGFFCSEKIVVNGMAIEANTDLLTHTATSGIEIIWNSKKGNITTQNFTIYIPEQLYAMMSFNKSEFQIRVECLTTDGFFLTDKLSVNVKPDKVTLQ